MRRRRPALRAALALAAGILAARWPDVPAAWWFGLGAAGAAAAFVLGIRRVQSRLAPLAVVLALVALGGARHWLAVTPLSPDHLGRFAQDEPALVHVTGTVATVPHVRTTERSHGTLTPVVGPLTTFLLTADTLRHADRERPASGDVLVMLFDVLDTAAGSVRAGRRVAVTGRLAKPRGATNPGQRLREDPWLAAILTTDHRQAIRPVPDAPRGHRRPLIPALRGHMARAIDNHLDTERARTLLGIIIGDRDRVESDLSRAFQVTGTAHLLAVSGLNVGLIAWGLWFVLRRLCVPERLTAVVAVLVVFLYGAVTGFHPGTLRACVMVTALALERVLRRDSDAVNSLGLAATVVLLANPTDLFTAGFQLSFVATLAILLFVVPIDRAAVFGLRFINRRTGRRELERPVRPAPQRWADRFLWRPARRVFIVSVVAWTATLPLRMHYFAQGAWIGAPATTVAAPCFWLTLASGLLLTVSSPVGLGRLVAPVARVSLDALTWVVKMMAAIGGRPALGEAWLSGGAVIACYAVVAVVALRVRWGLRWRWAAPGLVLAAAAAAADLLRDPRPSGLEVTTLDVGHGQCTILRTPEGRTVLFDAGSLTRSRGGARTVTDALNHFRVRAIDLVVLSHPDFDHYSALPDVLTRFQVGAVLVGQRFATTTDTDARTVLAHIREAGVPIRVARGGETILDLAPLRLDVLHPGGPDAAAWGDNDASLVVRAEYGGASVLSMGDLEEDGIRALLAGRPPLRSDVLLAPHHGSDEPNLAELVQAVAPAVVVTSGPHTDALKPALAKYRTGGAQVLVTGQSGAVTALWGRETLHVSTWRRPRLRLTIPRSPTTSRFGVDGRAPVSVECPRTANGRRPLFRQGIVQWSR